MQTLKEQTNLIFKLFFHLSDRHMIVIVCDDDDDDDRLFYRLKSEFALFVLVEETCSSLTSELLDLQTVIEGGEVNERFVTVVHIFCHYLLIVWKKRIVIY